MTKIYGKPAKYQVKHFKLATNVRRTVCTTPELRAVKKDEGVAL